MLNSAEWEEIYDYICLELFYYFRKYPPKDKIDIAMKHFFETCPYISGDGSFNGYEKHASKVSATFKAIDYSISGRKRKMPIIASVALTDDEFELGCVREKVQENLSQKEIGTLDQVRLQNYEMIFLSLQMISS